LPSRYKNWRSLFVVIPLWTNLLIRTYAWQILLAPEGLLARIAAALGFVASGDGLYPEHSPYTSAWFAITCRSSFLPLYASVEKIDWSLAEAAMDLEQIVSKFFDMRLCRRSRRG